MELTGQKLDYAKKYAKVVARAWSDPAYKSQLVTNPKEVLGQAGINFSPGIDVQIAEGASEFSEEDATGNTVRLPLPEKPADMGDEDLAKAASPESDISLCVSPCCCCG